MDPITTAILAAMTAGAISGLTEAGKSAITDAYTNLKALLIKKFGDKNDVVQAIHGLEAKPDSVGRKTILQEEIISAKADQDLDLLHAAQAIIQQIQGSPEGAQHIQTATGSYIAQADRGSSASVNIGRLPEP